MSRQSDETLPLGTEAGGDTPLDVLVMVAKDGGLARPLPAKGRVTIGRDGTCDVVIDDPSISRRHAVISCGDELGVGDLGSRNGTKVGAKVLRDDKLVPLARGEVVEIGRVLLVVQRYRGADEAARAIAAGARSSERRERERGAPADHDVVVGGVVERMLDLLARVARADIGVLLLGETGVGKDVFAEIIHRRSKRKDRPFVRIHCAALSESLLESELFGHEQGAFTGATKAKTGWLESADGGTVFFDEVGELPPSTQVKLLRVIEDLRVTRVGGTTPRKIDVRFVAATNKDLSRESERGAFRSDLFFRLSAMTITIPPLRERTDEILPMARAFLKKGERPLVLSREAEEALVAHPWPGNVRELKNVVARASVVANGEDVTANDLGLAPPKPSVSESVTAPTLSTAQREDAQRIAAALAKTAGNQTEAAKLLGISRRTLVSRLGDYGMPRPRGK